MRKNEPSRASETSSYKKVNVYIRVTFYGWEKVANFKCGSNLQYGSDITRHKDLAV
jgi:hypothetical protein